MVDVTREKLFELLWSKPATEVARELGVSDVAVNKLCQALQVPKPPRGYWARKRAGKRTRKPPLPAFQEHERAPRKREAPGVYLPPRQRELVERALEHLTHREKLPVEPELKHDRLTSLDADLVAALVIAIGQHYRRWLLPPEPNRASQQAAERTAREVVEKLLPYAKPRALVFSPPEEGRPFDRDHRPPDWQVVVHFDTALVQTLAELVRLVREKKLSFIARPLGAEEHLWRVRIAYAGGGGPAGQTELCVSATAAWIRHTRLPLYGDEPRISESEALPLDAVAPFELIQRRSIEIPTARQRLDERPFRDRLHRLHRAEQAFDIAEESMRHLNIEDLNGDLSQVLALWSDLDSRGSLRAVRDALNEIPERIDAWWGHMEQERERLCSDILGVQLGDAVTGRQGERLVTLLVERMTLHLDSERGQIRLFLDGRRYRKSGLPGKRSEMLSVILPWPG